MKPIDSHRKDVLSFKTVCLSHMDACAPMHDQICDLSALSFYILLLRKIALLKLGHRTRKVAGSFGVREGKRDQIFTL